MNQIQFETSKVFGVFVKINDFKEMKRAGMNLTGNFRIQYETTRGTVSTFTVDGIDENYKLQGFVSNLTDEQKEGVVDKSKFYNIYLDYVKGAYVEHLSLQKSFASLLTSLGIDENDNPILLTCNK